MTNRSGFEFKNKGLACHLAVGTSIFCYGFSNPLDTSS